MGQLFAQREGFPQGSPLSPGIANLFAAVSEYIVLRSSLDDDDKSRILRWVDDVLYIVDKNSEVWKKFTSNDFYSPECPLEDEGFDVYIGLDIAPYEKGILFAPNCPNLDVLSSDARLPSLRLAHAKSFESPKKNIARIESALIRVIDHTNPGNFEHLNRCIKIQILELLKFGFSKSVILKALYKIHRKWPYLHLDGIGRSWNVEDFEASAVEWKRIIDLSHKNNATKILEYENSGNSI